MKKKDNNGGFTLIEILVVIAIIAILTMVSIPYFIKYKKQTQITNIKKLLTVCARELAVEYTENSSILKKTCFFPETNDNCTIVLTPATGKVLIETDTCTMRVSNFNVKCEITSFGSINCYEVQ